MMNTTWEQSKQTFYESGLYHPCACDSEPDTDETSVANPKRGLKRLVLIGLVGIISIAVLVVGSLKFGGRHIPATAGSEIAQGVVYGQTIPALTLAYGPNIAKPQSKSAATPAPTPHTQPATKAQPQPATPQPTHKPVELASRGGDLSMFYNAQQAADENLLARLIHAEAGNQSMTGKIAVGNVVMNRIHSGKYPGSVRGVIMQDGQFETVSNGRINDTPDTSDIEAARAAINGQNVVGGALFFENPGLVNGGDWMAGRGNGVRIGDHVFYR